MNKPDNKSILGMMDPEVAEQIVSRRDALLGAGKLSAKLAMASVPVALGLAAKSAFAQTGIPADVVNALNLALILEELEAEFYTLGMNNAALIPAADQPIFDQIRKHEVAHVALLRSALGAQAVAKPTFDFTGGQAPATAPGFATALTSYATFLQLAQAFEDTGVRAYKGQLTNLMANKSVLTTAVQIHSVEARHASQVRAVRRERGFDTTKRWITGAQRGTLPLGLQPVYAGEDNSTQAGIAVTGITTVATSAVQEAFDEPLGRAAVIGIIQPFVVQRLS